MRRTSLPAFRPRRALAVTGLLALGSGLLMLAASAQPVQAAAARAGARTPGAPAMSAHRAAALRHERIAARPSPATKRQFEAQIKHLKAASHSSTTVTGPHMYDPKTRKPFPNASTVTVSQTTSLVNQTVLVSWTNFTPTVNEVGETYNSATSDYPVMVTECKGTNPTYTDCYGDGDGGVASSSGNVSPPNDAYAVTAPNGTGLTDMLILTTQENKFLGCDQNHRCSLAIVPAQGGIANTTPPDCSNHSEDLTTDGPATGGNTFVDSGYACSWPKRIIVPLTFARTPKNCPFRNPAFNAVGSPMAALAMNSWLASLCEGSHGVNINYDSTVGEPLALSDLQAGGADVALTTRAASAQGITTGTKKYLYAPIAVTAASVTYWFDNPVTGLPVTNVRLDQRLVLKLLTQSYTYNNACPPQVPGTPCDGGVPGDSSLLFTDPEFQQLNPEYASQNGQPPQVGTPSTAVSLLPMVQQGQSDMTWTVTNWIAASQDGKQFLLGQPDPWQEHLNLYYLGLQYPANTFVGQDPSPFTNLGYSPVLGLGSVATDMAENWPPGQDFKTPTLPPAPPGFQRFRSEQPGQRALVAIVDQGDAAAFLFPAAALPSPACAVTSPAQMLTKCHFVRPTNASMTAALQNMTSDGGTKLVNPTGTSKDAYPLTMVVYAVVPTSGTAHAKAAAIARFLDFAVGAGQHSGYQPGQLPPGFDPLPASMRAQTRKDAYDVLHQTGATAPKTTNRSTGPGSSHPSPSSAKKPGGVSLPTVGPSTGTVGPGISLVNAAGARPAPITRYILPALLILGGLAALAGSSSLIGSSSTPISARLRRIGQGSMARARAARGRLGLRRSK